jgi:hypothetical protein
MIQESIPPAYVVWRAVMITLFVVPERNRFLGSLNVYKFGLYFPTDFVFKCLMTTSPFICIPDYLPAENSGRGGGKTGKTDPYICMPGWGRGEGKGPDSPWTHG